MGIYRSIFVIFILSTWYSRTKEYESWQEEKKLNMNKSDYLSSDFSETVYKKFDIQECTIRQGYI